MPRAPKEKEKPAPPPTEEQMEAQDLDLTSASLEEEIKNKFSNTFIRALKKIAYYTAKDGLPLHEACALVDIDYEKFVEQMKQNPLIRKVIIMKELEFKRDMLHTITQRARSGDEKLAQWLLERKFPDEYGAKKHKPEGGDDVIFEAIQFIRRNGDNAPLVNEIQGRSIVVRTAQRGEQASLPSGAELKNKIDDILATPPVVLPANAQPHGTLS